MAFIAWDSSDPKALLAGGGECASHLRSWLVIRETSGLLGGQMLLHHQLLQF
jgi:hypothetical protein